MANAKKILFIPGWLDSGALRGYENSWDIWSGAMDINFPVETDYIVAHSIGSSLALAAWKNNSKLSLILVNPLLNQKHLLSRWAKCMAKEGTDLSWERLKIIVQLGSGLIKLT